MSKAMPYVLVKVVETDMSRKVILSTENAKIPNVTEVSNNDSPRPRTCRARRRNLLEGLSQTLVAAEGPTR